MRRTVDRHSSYHVYIVRCKDGTYYTGYTNNIEARVKLHNSGKGAKSLRGKRPVELVYVKEYRYYRRAVQAELALKKLTRKRKLELIKTFVRKCQGGPADVPARFRFRGPRPRNLRGQIKAGGPAVRVQEADE